MLKDFKMLRNRLLFIISIAVLIPNLAKAESRSLFTLPLDCVPNVTCFIQNYVDIDPSENVSDYSCKSATYDGHKGTDFRLLSTQSAIKGVAVIAAASGVVRAIRDGMNNRLLEDKNNPAIKNRECGNGVVIKHEEGWETQYCHLKKGSVNVQKGELISQGEKIGEVGYSGLAQFAHLHLTIRYNGELIDPFTGNIIGASCSVSQKLDGGLWDKTVSEAFIYRHGEILQSGFSTTVVSIDSLENGDVPQPPSFSSAPAIILYARFINLEKGDQVSLEIAGLTGVLVKNITDSLERKKAQYVTYSGLKRPKNGWAKGKYVGVIKLIREGEVVLSQTQVVEIE